VELTSPRKSSFISPANSETFDSIMLSIGLCAQLACIWEATARKPGNVHRFRDFSDTTYLDFIQSAAAIAPILDHATDRRVGETILLCIQATQAVTKANTNLGIVLLLAPLASVPPQEDLKSGLKRILENLDVAEARLAYEAIRMASPAGMGRVQDQDITTEPTISLREAMALAVDRDMIARQYCFGFRDVFDEGVPALIRALDQRPPISFEEAIIFCQLHLMAKFPDSLITRKRSQAESEEAARRASQALSKLWESRETRWSELSRLDAWLSEEGHSRNPGTTADLVTACLFIALREGSITLPLPIPFFADLKNG
jgi:triphosphoribosyl-dephospho-CoA synthase